MTEPPEHEPPAPSDRPSPYGARVPYGPPVGYGPSGYAAGVPGAPVTPGGGRPATGLGPRLTMRPEPRFGVALAGLGVALTMSGVLTIGSSSALSSHTGARSAIAIILSIAVTLAAYTLLAVRHEGPLVTAGVAASALGFESLVHFALSAGHAGTDVSVNVTALLSIAVWVASFVRAPGGRGHTFYLGLAAVSFWSYLLFVVDKQALLELFVLPFVRVTSSFGDNGVFYSAGPPPDFNSLAVLSILLGLIYYATAAILDRTGRAGLALPFVIAGAPATVVGLAVAAVNAPRALEGLLIGAISGVLALLGARSRRRFTTWFWTIGVGVGIVVLLVEAVGDDDTAAGISLVVIGLAVVGLATLIAQLLREPDELVVTDPRVVMPDQSAAPPPWQPGQVG